MVRKVKRRKSGIRIFVAFLLMVVIAALVYKSIIAPGNHKIFEKEYDDKTSSYSSLKITPDSSDDRTSPVPPSIEPDLSVEANPASATAALPGQFSVTFPDQGESAVGPENFGVFASTPNQTPVPIASVAKIMTAYLVLKAYPLQPGEDGPSLTMTARDVADYQNDLQNGYSVLKVALGEKLTEKQLLEGLMLPSGDNIASTLGRWVSGSEDAFVAKMNDTAQSLGMTKTHYADASGVSPATVSNAVDQIKIAQAAMENPVFREIVAMPQATIPVAGTVFNVDTMLGKHGIVGIKTGSTTLAGGNFVSATPLVVGDETHYIIGAVLGQKSLQSALDANAKILDQVRSEFKLYDSPAESQKARHDSPPGSLPEAKSNKKIISSS